MAKKLSKVVAVLLCVFMTIGSFSMVASAYKSETHDVYSKKTSTIAPGVTQDVVYAYNKEGNRIAYFVATADINDETVNVYANYTDNQCEENGMSKLREQMAAAQAKHSNPEDQDNYVENYKVVAGVNGDYFNMSTGKPSGAFVMEGTIACTDSMANARPFFAIKKDGTAMVGDKGDWTPNKSQIKEAVGGNVVIVKNGKDVTASATGSYSTDRHCRTLAGVTAEGKVVLVCLDGRQEPYSAGGNMHECAQIMLELNCVNAVNLDGGGSTTFAAIQPGENEVSLVNSPSDGAERAISSSLMIVSTAHTEIDFARAELTASSEYVTPESTVEISAKGFSSTDSYAEIPEDVEYALADTSFGKMDGNKFVSNGKAGDAVVQMKYNDEVVGTVTVHVVLPDSISFVRNSVNISLGSTADLQIKATYDGEKVTIKPEDFDFEIMNTTEGYTSANAGKIKGFTFIAPADNEENQVSAVTAIIKAKLKANEKTSAKLDVVFADKTSIGATFETQSTGFNTGWKSAYPNAAPSTTYKDLGSGEIATAKVVGRDNGQVKNGDYALAVSADFSQVKETGYLGIYRSLTNTAYTNAKRIGTWIYVPDDAFGLQVIVQCKTKATSSSTATDTSLYLLTYGEATKWDEPGWHYISTDISDFYSVSNPMLCLYVCDRDNDNYDYKFADNSSVNGKFTVYFDDTFTVDFNETSVDRDNPVVSDVKLFEGNNVKSVPLNKKEILDVTSDTVTVTADVKDVEAINTTGIDYSACKAYADGVEVSCKTGEGIVKIEDKKLSDGIHTIRFEVSDKAGNVTPIERKINVNTGKAPAITIVPQNPDADKILVGSELWYDIKAEDLSNVKSLTTKLNLNGVSTWDFDRIKVADGFKMDYTFDEDQNDVTFKFTKTGEVTSENDVLASFAVKSWESTLSKVTGYEVYTPEKLWSSKLIWPMDIKLACEYGSVTFADGTTDTFSMVDSQVDTELYGNYDELNSNGDYAGKTSWHKHTITKIIDAKDSSCSEEGLTSLGYCDVCKSYVEFQTPIQKKEHNFITNSDGLLECSSCGYIADGITYNGAFYLEGKIFTGFYEAEDGKTYYYDKGVLAKSKNVYVEDVAGSGKILLHKISATGEFTEYYTGSVKNAAVSSTRYTVYNNGELVKNDWVVVGSNRYYADKDGYVTYGSCVEIDGEYYVFTSTSSTANAYVRGPFTGTVNGKVVIAGKIAEGYTYTNSKYYDADGNVLNGWVDEVYYFNNGVPAKATTLIDGIAYTFNSSTFINTGKLTGTYSTLYYVNGIPYTGWVYSTNYINFYGEEHKQVKNAIVLFDGYYYKLDSSGRLISMETNAHHGGEVTFADHYVGPLDGGYCFDGGLFEGWTFADGLYYDADGNVADGWYTNAQGRNYYVINGEFPTGKLFIDDVLYDFGKWSTPKEFTGIYKDNYYKDGVKLSGEVMDDTYYVENDVVTKIKNDGTLGDKFTGLLNGKYYENGTEKDISLIDGKYVISDGILCDIDKNGEPTTGHTGIVNGVYYVDGVAQPGDVVADKYYMDNDVLRHVNSDGSIGAKFTGTADNTVYVNGKTLEGWNDDKYYVNGIALTGVQNIDGVYYSFDENGTYVDFYTGFLQDGEDSWIYVSNGTVVVNGWIYIRSEDQWYYFDKTGHGAKGTVTIDGRDYKFEGDMGKCLGAWVETDKGTRLYFCRTYYKNTWAEFDGEKYYFDNNGYRYEGTNAVSLLGNYLGAWEFDEDGKFVQNITGVFKDARDGLYHYAEDGVLFNGGVVKWNDDLYYARSNYSLATTKWFVSKTQANDLVEEGTYEFTSDAKMVIPEPTPKKNGICPDKYGVLCYFIDDVQQFGSGVVEIDGAYYYVRTNGRVVNGTSWFISNDSTNGIVEEGTYQFDADGKMIIPEPTPKKNGICPDKYGVLCYFIDDVQQFGSGVVEIDGAKYYVRTNGRVVNGTSWFISNDSTNGIVEEGTYQFDADGKMIIPEPTPKKNGVALDKYGVLCYYVDDVQQFGSGVVEVDGAYYYVRTNGRVVNSTSWFIPQDSTNNLVDEGTYQFDADGKMIIG